MNYIKTGDTKIGKDCPTYIIAEIGINHNGDLKTALKLIDSAVAAGCNAVKFQKRVPDLCVPEKQKKIQCNTPWGQITYLEYREKVELDFKDYTSINKYCEDKEITWFASCWDKASVDFIEQFNPCFIKIASACLTDDNLLKYVNKKKRLVILSTGMSTMEEINHAISLLNQKRLLIAHTTSSYTYRPEELNLRMIRTLQKLFDCPIGYSGHEEGLSPTIAAITLGACFLERHITLDRNMWGSDQKISLEPSELKMLVKQTSIIEKALGDGVKHLYDSEKQTMLKLRKYRLVA